LNGYRLTGSHLEKRILAQGQGGRELQPGGASEANALRGKYIRYFEDWKRAPDKEIGPKDFFKIASILIVLILLQTGCATFIKKTDTFPKSKFPGENAESLVEKLENANRTLVSGKGIGRMKYVQSGRSQHLRIAWISEVPEKLRITVLGVDGRPLITASTDGTWFYFLDHTTGEFHKSSPDGYRLKTALRLPLDVRSLALILAGRIPEFDYDRIEVSTGRTTDETVVVLKKWWNRVGKIYISKSPPAISRPAISRIESYDQIGDVRYIADINEIQVVKEYVVPRVLTINSGGANSFALDIDRYWVNETVDPETFILHPPE
jgi:hypothetical protein